MTKMTTIKAPIAMHTGEKYVPAGTEVTLDEEQANRLIEIHGEYGGANMPNDPGNTQVLSVLDKKSIEDLNTYAAINKGQGEDAPGGERHEERRKEQVAKQSAALKK